MRSFAESSQALLDCTPSLTKCFYREELSIPVFSNGGIEHFEDIGRALDVTKADGVMVSGSLCSHSEATLQLFLCFRIPACKPCSVFWSWTVSRHSCSADGTRIPGLCPSIPSRRLRRSPPFVQNLAPRVSLAHPPAVVIEIRFSRLYVWTDLREVMAQCLYEDIPKYLTEIEYRYAVSIVFGSHFNSNCLHAATFQRRACVNF